MPTQVSLPVAVQLYSLRAMPGTFAERLAQVSEAGYGYVEPVYDPQLPAPELRDLLDRSGLQAIASHTSYRALETDLDAVIAYQRAIGNDTLVVPSGPFQNQQTTDAADWQGVGHQLDAWGRRCRDAGMRLLYHNHRVEMGSHDGRMALDWILASSEPEHVGCELDLGWAVAGGGDPVALLSRYAGRVPAVHVKDLAPAGENEDEMGLADVGHGTLAWHTILPAARAAGTEWYIVEHDKPKDAMRTLRRSLAYLQGVSQLIMPARQGWHDG